MELSISLEFSGVADLVSAWYREAKILAAGSLNVRHRRVISCVPACVELR